MRWLTLLGVTEAWLAAAVDARTGKVPNCLNAALLAINMVVSLLSGARVGSVLLVTSLSALPALLIHRLGVGGGDLKLIIALTPIMGLSPWVGLAVACLLQAARRSRHFGSVYLAAAITAVAPWV
ncbi:MAG TPA: hypothetical protein ENG69_02555 [Candidatus Korarchaeota archaeon]|nr:hypothetical protein [Candidatus Korarchaeota archaeon]